MPSSLLSAPSNPESGSSNGSDVLPPTVSSCPDLPFQGLSWDQFERVCQDIVRSQGFQQVNGYGRPGQSQHGIDFRGIAPSGERFAFQAKRVEEFAPPDLRKTVEVFARGRFCNRFDTFVICTSADCADAKLQDEFAHLQSVHDFSIQIWGSSELTYRLRGNRNLVLTYFGQAWVNRFFAETSSKPSSSEFEALSIGPVEAFGLTGAVEEAQQIEGVQPLAAVQKFRELSRALRLAFPGHAARFDEYRARALAKGGEKDASHDLYMELAFRELFEKAEPGLSAGVARGLRELHAEVDEIRQARGTAVVSFGQCHERPDELTHIAERLDDLPLTDQYAPHIAALVAEIAIAHGEFDVIRNRASEFLKIGDIGPACVSDRIRAALADVGAGPGWSDLVDEANSSISSDQARSYLLLRAGRWAAWNGQLDDAEDHYKSAMKLSAKCELDLDVENALWSLNAIYTMRQNFDDLGETNRLALELNGVRSYIAVNSYTHMRAYRHLACGTLPESHYWAKYWLLESIRSGCLMNEIEAHRLLAHIYSSAGEPATAVEHAIMGGESKLVEEVATPATPWVPFAATALMGRALWMWTPALCTVRICGDLAPPDEVRRLLPALLEKIESEEVRIDSNRDLFTALGSVVLGASDGQLERLMSQLKRFAEREPGVYRLSDRGVGLIAARIYRFRTRFRQNAADVLGELATSRHIGDWLRAKDECGEDTHDLIASIENAALRKGVDLAGPLSELGHITSATRALWGERMRLVAEHPIGDRPEHKYPLRFDVPTEFLRENSAETIIQFVRKLTAIGADPHEVTVNRANALLCAASVTTLLPLNERHELFRSVQPLTDPVVQESQVDEYHRSTLHPLSRVRFSIGSRSQLQFAAATFMERAATSACELSKVRILGLRWVRCGESDVQRNGAILLTAQTGILDRQIWEDLATHHNPMVKRQALDASVLKLFGDMSSLDRFALDQSLAVRIGLAYSLPTVMATDANAFARIKSTLGADSSAVVRAITAEAALSAIQA